MLNEAWQECCHAERVSATFQCVSTAKVHLLTNTRMFAGVVFADILEAVMRFFTSLRFVQNDTVLPRASRFRRSSEAVKVIKTKRKRCYDTPFVKNRITYCFFLPFSLWPSFEGQREKPF